jgi:hypothetical protein
MVSSRKIRNNNSNNSNSNNHKKQQKEQKQSYEKPKLSILTNRRVKIRDEVTYPI